MSDVFGPTSIVQIESPDKPVRLTIEGLDEEIWLSSIQGGTQPNYQLMHAIGPQIYVNVFNQRLSMFAIGGIYVPQGCSVSSTNTGEPPFMTFYKRNNIGSSATTIKITFNGIVITGFLVKLDIGNYSQKNIDGHAFTMSFLGSIGGLSALSSGSFSSTGSAVSDASPSNGLSAGGSSGSSSGSDAGVRTGTPGYGGRDYGSDANPRVGISSGGGTAVSAAVIDAAHP